ncbi:FGGY-family carbohydrate kinase [Arenibaculum sp.]|uniref:FGGY-family carbohydrate kinase n=1 Tax=Arenibaculum sp. TaxID=2865862 RepID=UPI002E1248D5|nr:FGGY-family carbohydrate kinase [Arenibaculum sp.]
MKHLVLGVDVGTGSARAGLFDADGRRLGHASRDIGIWRLPGERVEQSSGDIWDAVSAAVREALAKAGARPGQVAGIGFDATCSLVLSTGEGEPLALGDGSPTRDVVVWMDHRAVAEAAEITATGDVALEQVGGTISPEMQLPKLLWVKRHRPDLWRRLGRARDLGDWLTWRATGSDARSSCTTVCKWCFDYGAHRAGGTGWPLSLLASVGLTDLLDRHHAVVGAEVLPPGTPLGAGLSARAARELGLEPGTPVAAAAIDAHAGAIGVLGSVDPATAPDARLALVAGTSSCLLIQSVERLPVQGVWGPYRGALTGNGWLAEAGQSATGAFLDRLIQGHPASGRLQGNPHAALAAIIEGLLARSGIDALLGDRLVLPDVLGNRSPLADPTMTGAITGLTLDGDERDLARLYLAGLFSLAYGSRHIVETLSAGGHRVEAIVATGSGAGNGLLMQAHADVCGVPVYLPAETEGVLLGAAMLGAVAGGVQPDLDHAMRAMASGYRVLQPDPRTAAAHDRRYRASRRLQETLRDLAVELRQDVPAPGH